MSEAVGIHDHPFLKTGLIPTDPAKPILSIDAVLTGITPPPSEDRYSGVTFGLDGNDKFGTCGPTAVDNDRRSTSYVATGAQRTASESQVFDLYKTQNPNFNPNVAGLEDNGVEMGSMLDALLKVGLAGDKPVAFGRLKDMSDASLERAVAVFGGVLFAVELETAQQMQSEGASPMWDYHHSPVWGGHAIYCGKYSTASGVNAPVISWDMEIGTTDAFRAKQLQEVWIIIWPWHLEHPAFLEGVDQAKLAEAFNELTGEALPLPAPGPTPTPTPAPTPIPGTADANDVALWQTLQEWAVEDKHIGENREAANAAKTWAQAKGLL